MLALDPNIAIPSEFICPISLEIMEEPVVLSDGQSYERSFIEAWFQHNDTIPTTNERVRNKTLTPNRRLQESIQRFVQSHSQELQSARKRVSEANNLAAAAAEQMDEAMGLALESRLDISRLEYQNRQLEEEKFQTELSSTLEISKLQDEKRKIKAEKSKLALESKLKMDSLSQQKKKLVDKLSAQQKQIAFLQQQAHEMKLSPSERKKCQDQLSSINEALKDKAGDSKIINKKATISIKLGLHAEALKTLNSGLRADAKNIYLLNTRASLFKKIGKFDVALREYWDVLATEPRNIYAWDGLAAVYRIQGDTESEQKCIKMMSRIDPNHWRVKKNNEASAEKVLKQNRTPIMDGSGGGSPRVMRTHQASVTKHYTASMFASSYRATTTSQGGKPSMVNHQGKGTGRGKGTGKGKGKGIGKGKGKGKGHQTNRGAAEGTYQNRGTQQYGMPSYR